MTSTATAVMSLRRSCAVTCAPSPTMLEPFRPVDGLRRPWCWLRWDHGCCASPARAPTARPTSSLRDSPCWWHAKPIGGRRDGGVHLIGVRNVTVHRDRLNQLGISAFGIVASMSSITTYALVRQGTRSCPAEADGGAGSEGGAPAESHTISAVGGAVALVSILAPSGVSSSPSVFIAAL
jgi:hypothetical protein